MKKTLIPLLFVCLCTAVQAQQQPVVAVAPFEALSGISVADANTITEIYSIRLSAAKAVRVVTREALDKVIREHGFQTGDWSDDNKTAALGAALNADWVVRGTLRKLDNRFVITVSILDIKSLEVMGGADMRINSIGDAYDKMGDLVTQTVQTISGGRAGGRSNTETKEYKIGDAGPAGGWIFYDKGRVINGWRYLEAAPTETEVQLKWGAYLKKVSETGTVIGTGKQNTQIIVKYLQNTGESGKAAQYCDSLVVDGYDDWFLPSKDELNLIYQNLKTKGLGEFSAAFYWSSSQLDRSDSWVQHFKNGRHGGGGKHGTFLVRAVRAF
jgi:TolB-like protein